MVVFQEMVWYEPCPCRPGFGHVCDLSKVCCKVLEFSAQKRHRPVGADLEDTTTIIEELEALCCEDKLRQLGLFSLEKVYGGHSCGLTVHEVAYKQDGNNLFIRAFYDRARADEFKLKEGNSG